MATKEKKDTKASDEAKVSKREAARAEKEALASKQREQLIKSGDLIEAGELQFTSAAGTGVVADVMAKIIPDLRKATKTPVVVSDLAEKHKYKYPEDLAPAFHTLEILGMVRRFEVRKGGAGRPSPSYLWIA